MALHINSFLAKYFPSETLEPAHMYDTPLTLQSPENE